LIFFQRVTSTKIQVAEQTHIIENLFGQTASADWLRQAVTTKGDALQSLWVLQASYEERVWKFQTKAT
jgi:hypothetical protein